MTTIEKRAALISWWRKKATDLRGFTPESAIAEVYEECARALENIFKPVDVATNDDEQKTSTEAVAAEIQDALHRNHCELIISRWIDPKNGTIQAGMTISYQEVQTIAIEPAAGADTAIPQ